MTDLLILATEDHFVPADHIAADLSVPLGILVFCGSCYLLLWAIYGAKKAAAVYSVAWFGFTMVLGVFWWFGAPGTVVATGLRSFPGQATDTYNPKWFAMEPGSERAAFFPSTQSGEGFVNAAEYVGKGDLPREEWQDDLKAASIVGDLDTAASRMVELFLPVDDGGTAQLGAARRTAALEAAGDPQPQACPADVDPSTIDCEKRASPFFTARVVPDSVIVQDDAGHRVAQGTLELVANWQSTNENGAPVIREVVVETQTLYAFKDPGALWWPSAVWTVGSLILFALSLFWLDRIEQREKQQQSEAEEPMDIPVTVGAGV